MSDLTVINMSGQRMLAERINIDGQICLVPVYSQSISMPTVAVNNADTAAPAVNTAATVTYTAPSSNYSHVISGVSYSYDTTPTGGNITIKDGTIKVYNVDVAASGERSVYFDPPKKFTTGSAASITLAAGGASVTGKVSVLGHWLIYGAQTWVAGGSGSWTLDFGTSDFTVLSVLI